MADFPRPKRTRSTPQRYVDYVDTDSVEAFGLAEVLYCPHCKATFASNELLDKHVYGSKKGVPNCAKLLLEQLREEELQSKTRGSQAASVSDVYEDDFVDASESHGGASNVENRAAESAQPPQRRYSRHHADYFGDFLNEAFSRQRVRQQAHDAAQQEDYEEDYESSSSDDIDFVEQYEPGADAVYAMLLAEDIASFLPQDSRVTYKSGAAAVDQCGIHYWHQSSVAGSELSSEEQFLMKVFNTSITNDVRWSFFFFFRMPSDSLLTHTLPHRSRSRKRSN